MSDPIQFWLSTDKLGRMLATLDEVDARRHAPLPKLVTIQPELLDAIGYALRTPLPPQPTDEP